ncbi:MAG: hypothetical protein ABI887_08045 [Burkholderiales bacterium]
MKRLRSAPRPRDRFGRKRLLVVRQHHRFLDLHGIGFLVKSADRGRLDLLAADS